MLKLLLICLMASSHFVRVQAEPQRNLFLMLSDSVANSARYFSRTIGNILNIQNPVTSKLCDLRTVRELHSNRLETEIYYLN